MTGAVHDAVPRILIVRVGAMGDVIHALPAVAMLRSAMPEAHLGWAVEPRWAPLLRAEGAAARDPERMPLVDAVHLVEAKAWNRQPLSAATVRSIATLRRELRSGRYDIAIDLQGTLRSGVIARLSGAGCVVGSASPRESLARYLYGERVPRMASHVIDQALELVEAAIVGCGTTVASRAGDGMPLQHDASPLLPHDTNAEAWWQRWREEHCGTEPIALLAATAGWGAKEWPPEKFAELAAALVPRGYCVLFNTTPHGADEVTARVIARIQQRHPDQAAKVLPLPATLPQLIAATRDARAVIGGDTGPLHLAAALGVPTIGLFGPTAPERTGPRHPAINLRHSSSVTDHRRHARTEAGLAQLSADAVLEAFERVTGSHGAEA